MVAPDLGDRPERSALERTMRLFASMKTNSPTRTENDARASEPPTNPDGRPIVEAISPGSRDAFVTLFDVTAGAIRAELTEHLPDAERAIAVFAATYVEVWWLAGCHSDSGVDVVDWIRHILYRRIADAYPSAQQRARPPVARLDAVVDPWPSHAEIELATLLRRPVQRLWPA